MSAHSRILALLLLPLVTACQKPAPEPTSPEPVESTAATPEPGTTKIANPASEHCVAKGGSLEIVAAPEGEHGVCTLPDGTKCEEWAYFRGECP